MKFVAKLLLAALLFSMPNCFAEVILRFQPLVHDDAARLGDILLIENDEAQWANLPLQSHPISGEVITKDKVLDWIKPTSHHLHVTWQGKTTITVHRSPQSSKQRLIDKAKTTLNTHIASQYQRVKLTPMSDLHDSEFAIDDLTASVRVHYPVAKRVCVWLTPQQHPDQRIAVWFKVQAYAKVWVAKHHLHENAPLLQASFTLIERDIAGLKGQPVKSFPTQVLLKSSLDSQQVLLENQLKQPPLVSSGQSVKVTIRNAHITISMDAIALGEGGLGQTITVKNPLNQKTFAVRISGFQQAEITS